MRYAIGKTLFNMSIILRILSTLHEEGRMNITNLASRTRLNYSKCMKYINLMALLGWIKVIFDETHYLAITEKGFEVIDRFSIVH